jgi:hypothetical protein
MVHDNQVQVHDNSHTGLQGVQADKPLVLHLLTSGFFG